VKRKLREELRRRKRRLEKRIDKHEGAFSESKIGCGPVRYDLSGKLQAVACGGLGMISQVVRQLDLRNRIFAEDQVRYFFYITNTKRKSRPARAVIRLANQRCNQENTISQLRACHALSAPLDSLESNHAYMLFASLAWNLKQWSALLVRTQGPPPHQAKQKEDRQKILRMEFATFFNGLVLVPAQIIRSARRTIWRLLTWRPAVDWLLMLHDHIIRLRPAHATPLRL
jgi:Transposase DDE domain